VKARLTNGKARERERVIAVCGAGSNNNRDGGGDKIRKSKMTTITQKSVAVLRYNTKTTTGTLEKYKVLFFCKRRKNDEYNKHTHTYK